MEIRTERNHRFARYAWSVLLFNVLVILWGAVVRATGSGAGCGAHWPTCNGAVVPMQESLATAIEFTHRLTSGIALILVVVLYFWARRSYVTGSAVRRGATASLVFMVGETLIGAVLVLFSLTATNTSVARAFVIALHLVNTFLLLAGLALTAWWASEAKDRIVGRHALWSMPTSIALIVLGASGAVTALGDTLLLNAGIRPEDSVLLATLIELRIAHPLLAVGTGLLLWLTVRRAHWRSPITGILSGQTLLILYFAQLLLGAINVYLRAPIWLQIVHLLLSDIIWILFVLLLASPLFRPTPTRIPAHLLEAPITQTGD